MSDIGILAQAVAKTSRLAGQNIEKSKVPTYTGEDGYIHCSICHERLTRHVELFPGQPPVLVNCVCEHTSSQNRYTEREKLRDDELKRSERIRSLPNAQWRDFTFENDNGNQSSLTNVLKSYVENYADFAERSQGILLYGGVGTGKTYMAASVINALVDKGVPCIMTSLSDIVDKTLRGNWSDEQVKAWLSSKKVIAFDDLGAERDTEYANEKIFTVVNALCGAKKSLIFTTNLTIEELNHPQDKTSARIYDRIMGCCVPLEVRGKSQRRSKAIHENETNRKLLGL